MNNRWILLSVGGILGTFARYLVAIWIAGLAGVSFPYGTLTINLTACFLIGIFNSLSQVRAVMGPEARLLLMTGFCGAYSTFSTWILESSNMFADGEFARALINLFGSAALGLLVFWLGSFFGTII